MAKAKRSVKKIGGPFLAAAVFCDRILQDNDNSVSAIRIVDAVKLQIPADAPPDVPSKEQRLLVQQNLLLFFRTGDAPGKHTLKIVLQQPSGKRQKVGEEDIDFTGAPNGGSHAKITVKIAVYTAGIFWFDVYLDGKRFTRVPLDVSFERQGPAGGSVKSKSESPKTK